MSLFTTDDYFNTWIGVSAVPGELGLLANVITGTDAAKSISTPFMSNIVIGAAAFSGGRNVSANIAIGPATAYGVINASQNVILGPYTASGANTLFANTIVGSRAGEGMMSANNNVILGPNTGQFGTSNSLNVVAGPNSFQNASGNSFNVILGTNTASGAVSLTNAVILGHNVSGPSNCDSLIAIGNCNLSSFTGGCNILIGSRIGNATVSNVIAIGNNLNLSGLSSGIVLGSNDKTVLYADATRNLVQIGGTKPMLEYDPSANTVTSNSVSEVNLIVNGIFTTPYYFYTDSLSLGIQLPDSPMIILGGQSWTQFAPISLNIDLSDSMNRQAYNYDVVVANVTPCNAVLYGRFSINGDLTTTYSTDTVSALAVASYKKILLFDSNEGTLTDRYKMIYVRF
jgi:hypothetical protein